MTASRDGLSGHHLLVTGASGFLGSAFVRFALRAGAEVTALCRSTSSEWRLRDVAGQYRLLTASMAAVDLGSRPPSIVVHFAAAGVNQLSDDVADMVATNVVGTGHMLELARRHDVSRFVLVGTSGEYGSGVLMEETAPLRPTSEYGATRAGATLLAQAFGARRNLDVVVVRPFAVYGPYEAAYRLVPHVILNALRGQPVRISSGRQTRDYVYVEDVCDGIARACTTQAARGRTFNLCTGVETSVQELATRASELAGSVRPVEAGAVATMPGEMWRTTGNPALSHEVLNWSPSTDLGAGLTATIQWFRSRGQHLPQYSPPAST